YTFPAAAGGNLKVPETGWDVASGETLRVPPAAFHRVSGAVEGSRRDGKFTATPLLFLSKFCDAGLTLGRGEKAREPGREDWQQRRRVLGEREGAVRNDARRVVEQADEVCLLLAPGAPSARVGKPSARAGSASSSFRFAILSTIYGLGSASDEGIGPG